MKNLTIGMVGLLIFAASNAAAKAPNFQASITRTNFGIPHITARDWRGIGYGVGYSYAQDNLCLIAEEFVTLAGERSLHFGPAATSVVGFEPVDNLSADIFFRSAMDLPKLRTDMQQTSMASQDLRSGYVAGYNRYLRDIGPSGIPIACRGKAWVRPINMDDMLRLGEKQALLAGSLAFAPAIANASPPNAESPVTTSSRITLPRDADFAFGSNGWAFGKEATANGRGLLVGNPHFPWNGPSRFYQMHITIPGQVDVMGAGLGGSPMPQIGFNKDVAWTHTVTAASHFTLHELKLDAGDPTSYIFDGQSIKMEAKSISVPMPDGAPPVTRMVYSTRFGPMVETAQLGLNWNSQTAYAIRDANAGNQRTMDTWLGIIKARSVAEIRNVVETTLGIPWVNTIATDRHGNALLADVTAAPNVSAQKLQQCSTALSARLAGRVFLLDGSRAECDWDVATGTPVAGLKPANQQAVIARRDYVANSNDSYWLTNPSEPHRQLSPILGDYGTARSLRTRSGLVEINRRLTGADGGSGNLVNHENAKSMIFANKSLAAEMVLDEVLLLCQGKEDLAAACDVLSKWDRLYNVESRGSYLFWAFWEGVIPIRNKWAVPFDVNDPINTPRDLVTSGETGDKILTALRAAVARLASENIALDAPWGSVQVALRGQDRIAIHGADGALGVLNMQRSVHISGGITPFHGSSYIQVVSFGENGPIADAILSYSQSTNPASPFYGDQTRNYSGKRWNRLPFTPQAIARDSIGRRLVIRE
jgi:acyl-homoserine-lactone acylase